MKPPYAIGSVPSLLGHVVAYRWRSLPRVRRHRASKSQGSSERVLPWQITMDQLIFASLSHTHYWYEVGMLKVPADIQGQTEMKHTKFKTNKLTTAAWTKAENHKTSKKGFLRGGSDGVDHVARRVLQHGVVNKGSPKIRSPTGT